jgi:hypothetical protein
MLVGKHDVFERKYMGRFRDLAAQYGEAVEYERDRGGRDFGLHLTWPARHGESEVVSSSLVWFQLKGIHATTLTKELFNAARTVELRLAVKHLQLWYMLPSPTYLVVYVEAVDRFLVLNIQKYVEEHWGDDILTVDQETVPVEIDKAYVLDETAFRQILVENEAAVWAKRFQVTHEGARLTILHQELIHRAATAKARKVKLRMHIRDWQTKMRTEFEVLERPQGKGNGWTPVWAHWMLGGGAGWCRRLFPYLLFEPVGDNWDVPLEYQDEPDRAPWIEINDRHEAVYGHDTVEYHDYELNVSLNALGEELASWLDTLDRAGIIRIDMDSPCWLDMAPWHARGV